MTIDQMLDAIQEARCVINRSDHLVEKMTELIAGKLRSGRVRGGLLCRLKEELRSYNIHTNTWRS